MSSSGEAERERERADTDIASRSLFREQDLRPSSRSSWCLFVHTNSYLRESTRVRSRITACIESISFLFSSFFVDSPIPICELYYSMHSRERIFRLYLLSSKVRMLNNKIIIKNNRLDSWYCPFRIVLLLTIKFIWKNYFFSQISLDDTAICYTCKEL